MWLREQKNNVDKEDEELDLDFADDDLMMSSQRYQSINTWHFSLLSRAIDKRLNQSKNWERRLADTYTGRQIRRGQLKVV